jgi:hypothetical protein
LAGNVALDIELRCMPIADPREPRQTMLAERVLGWYSQLEISIPRTFGAKGSDALKIRVESMQIALSNAVGAVWLWPDLCLSSHRDEVDQTVGQGGAHEY